MKQSMKQITSAVLLLTALPLLIGLLPAALADSADLGNIAFSQSKYSPYPAEPGQYLTVWINAYNGGSSDVRDAVFKFEPDYPFQLNPGEDGLVRVGKIPVGQDKLVEYTLRVDERAIDGSYILSVKLCLNDDCSSESQEYELPVSIRTGGAPRIELGLEETDLFSPGALGKFTINIVNRGELDTKFLTVEVAESDKYEIIGPSEKYIGELESDDFETAEYQVFIEGASGNEKEAEKSGVLDVQIRVEYSDENNKQYTEYQAIPLKVYSAADLKKMHLSKSPSYWSWIVILILLGAGWLAWRRHRRRARPQ